MSTCKEKYRKLCEVEKSICVYDQPWWLDAICGSDWDVFLQYSGDEIEASMVYYKKQKMKIGYITQPPFTQHNGPWIREQDGLSENKKLAKEKKLVTAFLNSIESICGISFFQQTLNITTTNWLPYFWMGYKQTTRYTYRINDISNLDVVLSGMHHSKRQNIKKAKKKKLQFNYDLNSKDFYEFHKKTLEELGKKIEYSYDLFKRIYDAAYSNKTGRVFFVTDEEGKLLSALFNIWDNNCAYDLISAVSLEGRKTCALDYCVWNAISEFSAKGIKSYDFEGSMIENVEESFRKFGAIQTPYFKIYKTFTKNPIIRAVIEKKLK